MRKNIHVGWALAFIVAGALLAWAIVSWETDRTNRIIGHADGSLPGVGIDHASSSTPPADIQSFSFDLYPGGDKEVSVSYPVLKPGYASPIMTARINADIASTSKADFQSSVSDLKQSVQAEADTASGSATADGNPDANKGNGLSFQELVTDGMYANASTHVFSYDASAGGYSGGAHDNHFYVSYAYDTQSGNLLSLGDLLKGKYQAVISGYAHDAISKAIKLATPLPGCLNCERLEADPDHMWWNQALNPQNFVLSADGITFLFGDYELGPYSDSAGGQEIFVPKAALKDFIRRDW